MFKLLVVDDEEKIREVIREYAEFQGHTVVEARDGIEVDVDEILRYFAVNTFLVNLDSYASNMKHNYYLYEREGKFQILPWDLNMSFAGFQVRDGKTAINFPIDTPVSGDSMENSPLISKLLEVGEYKQTYHKYLRELVDDYINSGEYETAIKNIDSLIGEYVKNDPTAFYTYEQYQKSIPSLRQFGKDRSKSVMAQLEGKQPSTSYGTMDTSVDLSLLGLQGKGGKMPHSHPENMPEREIIEQAIKVLRGIDDTELTSEQKTKLRDLGLTDTQIEEMVKMKNQMPFGNDEKQKPGEFKPGESKQGLGPPDSKLQYSNRKEILIVIAGSILILLATLVFVSKFKRM